MPEEIEKIEVLRPHLEQILRTVDRALAKAQAEDLAEHYRLDKGNATKQTALTGSLQQAFDRIAGYLEVEAADELS